MLRGRSATSLVWIGGVLSILAVVFVIRKLVVYSAQIEIPGVAAIWLALSGLAVSYGIASLLLAAAWRNVVRHLALAIDYRSALHIWGVSQLSKYVPGNVFQFVGRQALGLSAGLPMWPLVKSTGLEIALLAVSAGLYSVLVLPHRFLDIPLQITATSFGLAIAVALWLAGRTLGPWIARAMAWQLIFHLLSGLCFLAVMLLLVPEAGWTAGTAIYVCAAYIVAWLAGFLTPGAPAGVGIREFVLYALLQPVFSEADVLAAILLGRLVTTAGDLGLYFLALGCRPPSSRSA